WALSRPPVAVADPCAEGDAQVAAVWQPDRRATVEQRLAASGLPGAAELARRTATGIDRYTAAWQSARRAACTAARGARGPAADTAAAQLACFDRRLVEIDAAIEVLAGVE